MDQQVVRLNPVATVEFPTGASPTFTFVRQQGSVPITVTATTWDPATGHAKGQTGFGGSCVDLPVSCGVNPTTNVCYSLVLDVTFTAADQFSGSLVVHQQMSPDCGPSLCLTTYAVTGTRGGVPSKTWSWR
jgi:hypothetical protein